MSLFLTADYHLGHENIIDYCGRPFKSLEQHDKNIIRAHNERVGLSDTIIHAGDFCFRNSAGGKKGEGVPNKAEHYIEQLNGRLTFVDGNHDKNNGLKTNIHSLVLRWGNEIYYVVHDPEHAVGHMINFVGHVHEEWKFKRVRIGESFTDLINVGIDVWGFMPVKIEEALKEYKRWEKNDRKIT